MLNPTPNQTVLGVFVLFGTYVRQEDWAPFTEENHAHLLMHLQHTSLVHAYLFVSVTPLAIAVGSLLLRKPISRGEVAGTLLGVLGAAVLTLGPKAGHREVRRRQRTVSRTLHSYPADAVQQSSLLDSSAH